MKVRFLEILADVAADWTRTVHGRENAGDAAPHRKRAATISRRHARPSVPKNAGATGRTTAAPPALDVLLAALKSAATTFAAGFTGAGATVAVPTVEDRAGSIGPSRLPAQPPIATTTLAGFRLCNTHYVTTTSPATTHEEWAAPGRDNPAPAEPWYASDSSLLFPGSTSPNPTRWPLCVHAEAAGSAADLAPFKRPVVTVFPGQPIGPAPASWCPLALGRGGVGGSSAFAPVAPGRAREGPAALVLPPLQLARPS